MKVAFLVNDLQLSGGVGVVVQHARQLSTIEGWDVTLVLVREEEGPSWHGYEHLPHLHVRSREQALSEHYDVAVATWWETMFTLFELSAERYAYFVQSLEDRFYRHDEAERLGAGLNTRPAGGVHHRGDVDRRHARGPAPRRPLPPRAQRHRQGVFAPPERAPINTTDPLRVLVEGSPVAWFKHVHEAIHAAAAMREPHHVTVVCGDRTALGEVVADEIVGPLSHREMADLYARTDVVLKLSSVEGMFGPPLEGFHRGATRLVTPVTGHDEYVEHGWNGLLTDWDDLRGTARQLDLLARDRELLQFLRANALETARAWPSWEQSSQFMAGALLKIRREPPAASAAASARLLADLRGGIEIYGGQLHERAAFARRALRVERVLARLRRSAAVRGLQRLRRYRALQFAARPLRPLTSRVRRWLS